MVRSGIIACIKAKAMTLLAHKLGRAVYFMLKREKLFDQDRFLATA
jgi:hypothetical protein